MKKKFIVIMIIVILLVIAFFILIKEYLVKIPAGFSLYRNSKMGVSFAYPVNWFMEDKIKDETIVITPPDYDKDNICPLGFNVLIRKKPADLNYNGDEVLSEQFWLF
ncbi:MAG: hypothetical protein A2W55_02450 [Candidatus Nealsonbacteria bacterium RIFCSPHIGHO2_02_38_10]|nr:MAG: hypothetical protein UT22_C0009G0006 [Parcubacteria group bacterium GW2011_GWC2_39_11]OGZ20787.1 MAG: hypothetical protein A2W55_02450 [Candidatus Nealsonbacteria bacterium RIFCSPHIGHO2_02_38_10]